MAGKLRCTACRHHLLRHRELKLTVCPHCDAIGSWPRWPKGTWKPAE